MSTQNPVFAPTKTIILHRRSRFPARIHEYLTKRSPGAPRKSLLRTDPPSLTNAQTLMTAYLAGLHFPFRGPQSSQFGFFASKEP